MNHERDGFFISTDQGLLNVDFIWQSLNRTYWAGDRTREAVAESIRNSLCFGVYEAAGRTQVGFARVVTDKATFSWICDVFVDDRFRGNGLGTWLMACVTAHPYVQYMRSVLGTRDAHGLYEKFGFERLEMMRRPPSPRSEPTP